MNVISIFFWNMNRCYPRRVAYYKIKFFNKKRRKEIFNVVINTAPNLVAKRIKESKTPNNKVLQLEIETMMPKKTKKKVLIRKATSASKRFKPLLTNK
jgi:hypothetical protein